MLMKESLLPTQAGEDRRSSRSARYEWVSTTVSELIQKRFIRQRRRPEQLDEDICCLS